MIKGIPFRLISFVRVVCLLKSGTDTIALRCRPFSSEVVLFLRFVCLVSSCVSLLACSPCRLRPPRLLVSSFVLSGVLFYSSFAFVSARRFLASWMRGRHATSE